MSIKIMVNPFDFTPDIKERRKSCQAGAKRRLAGFFINFNRLFVTQRVHRFQTGCPVGRIDAEEQSDCGREERRQQDRAEVYGWIERAAASSGNPSD